MNATVRLDEAISACGEAREGHRRLDALIARAVFPGLSTLTQVEEAVWQQDDGTRVRALRYTASAKAAVTLVPAGCWIEQEDGEFVVQGPSGQWSAMHECEPIGICLAALQARRALLQ